MLLIELILNTKQWNTFEDLMNDEQFKMRKYS